MPDPYERFQNEDLILRDELAVSAFREFEYNDMPIITARRKTTAIEINEKIR